MYKVRDNFCFLSGFYVGRNNKVDKLGLTD